MCCVLVQNQGFQLPLTMAQQWQCHYLLDAAAAAAPGATSALDKACHLLGAIACPTTPFRCVCVWMWRVWMYIYCCGLMRFVVANLQWLILKAGRW